MNAPIPHKQPGMMTTADLQKYLTDSLDSAPPLNAAIMLAGAPGTGKTRSALEIARGLSDGKRFAFVDTENKRGLHQFPFFAECMTHINMREIVRKDWGGQHTPEAYITIIQSLEAAGYPVIVIDSFSHVHEGLGGILEIHERELTRIAGTEPAAREKNTYSAWGPVKPRERALIDAIVGCRAHVILTARAKPTLTRVVDKASGKTVNLRKTKLKRDDIPFDVAATREIIWEMTISGVMRPEPENRGTMWALKLPDELYHAFPLDQQINASMGRKILEWSRFEGDVRERCELYNRARQQARKGRASMKDWYAKLSAEQKRILVPLGDELLSLSEQADQSPTARQENPFDAPAGEQSEDEGGLTPEQQAEQERAWAEIQAQRAAMDETRGNPSPVKAPPAGLG